MKRVNVSGYIFTIKNEIYEKIELLKILERNQNNFNDSDKDNILCVQQDPKIFQMLLNYLTLPGYKPQNKHKSNLIAIFKMFMMVEPYRNINYTHVHERSVNHLKITDINNINTISVRCESKEMLRNVWSGNNNHFYGADVSVEIKINNEIIFDKNNIEIFDECKNFEYNGNHIVNVHGGNKHILLKNIVRIYDVGKRYLEIINDRILEFGILEIKIEDRDDVAYTVNVNYDEKIYN